MTSNLCSHETELWDAIAAGRWPDTADANLRATNERFRLGAAGVGVVELVQAQTQFFTANNNLVQARYDVVLAQAQLQRATGR